MGRSTEGGFARRELLGLAALGALGASRMLPGHAAAGAPRGEGRADSVILVFLGGGPSHLDMWDMKPDAPAEIRGEFRPIATSVPGVQLCEHLPRLARQMHRCTLIRSVTHDVRISHSSAAYACLTGHLRGEGPAIDRGPSPDDYPAIGSAVGRLRPGDRGVLPYVWLPHETTELGVPLSGMGGGALAAPSTPSS